MRSPGHPKLQRHVEAAFWAGNAKGLLPTEAAAVPGVAQAVGHGGSDTLADLIPTTAAHPLTSTGVDIGLDHPAAHGLLPQAQLASHRLRRRCGRGVLIQMLAHQTHSPLVDSGIDLLRHNRILPDSRQSGREPGKNQNAFAVTFADRMPAAENL